MHFLPQTLVADLEGDTHGDFEDLLVALVTPPAVYDCHEILSAIKVRLISRGRICMSYSYSMSDYSYNSCEVSFPRPCFQIVK